MTLRRILSVWFPRLPTDLSIRMMPCDSPMAMVLRAGNTDRLHCVTPAAEQRGLRRGMGLADARAICPDLVTRPADPVREAALLMALVRWTGRYAPWVGPEGADGLVADISGVPHLFGGEEALRDDLLVRLARAGFTARAAIADTRGAAYAMVRHDGTDLRTAPIALLRVGTDLVDGLRRLGLHRIGDLADVPRGPLARRFGAGLLLRLDQATGAQPEPVSPSTPPVHYGVRLTLPDPIGLSADVMAGLERLLERLCATLATHAAGARGMRLELRRVDNRTEVVEIGFARPMRDPHRIVPLFRSGVEAADAGFGIDALRLVAIMVEPLAPVQITGSGHSHEDAHTDLITRLGNRMGFEAVQTFIMSNSLIPERSYRMRPASNAAPKGRRMNPKRPPLIFPPEAIAGTPPLQFLWRDLRYTALQATGPERIAPDWWQDDPDWISGMRDYWRVQTQQGRRLWLFHTPQDPAWFVQGEFS